MNEFESNKLRDLSIITWCSASACVLSCIFSLMVVFSYAEPNFDALGLMMAVLQTFLSIVAVGGFFLIRNLAANRAVETAQNELEKYLQENGRGTLLIRRSVANWLAQNPASGDSDSETNQIMEGLDD